MNELTLFSVITAHCIFHARCRHAESGPTPEGVHDAMEAHYQREHRADIDRLLGVLTPPSVGMDEPGDSAP